VQVFLESRSKGQGDFDWKVVTTLPTPNPITLVATGAPVAGQTIWAGSIPNAPSSDTMTDIRIRIEESEVFQADNGATGVRPVFVDTFPITI
jgi:hypothetical protein